LGLPEISKKDLQNIQMDEFLLPKLLDLLRSLQARNLLATQRRGKWKSLSKRKKV